MNDTRRTATAKTAFNCFAVLRDAFAWDDGLYDCSPSIVVELMGPGFGHAAQRMRRGFLWLTLVWANGQTIILAGLSRINHPKSEPASIIARPYSASEFRYRTAPRSAVAPPRSNRPETDCMPPMSFVCDR